jgi:hypothetical protein
MTQRAEVVQAGENHLRKEARTMASDINCSDDELIQLHLLLSRELESSRVELHHTAGRPYRDYIKQRMAQQEALLKKLGSALPMAHVPASASV